MTKERDSNPGDIIEAPNGNRYLILEDRSQIYVGHEDLWRIPASEKIPERPLGSCKIIGKIKLKRKYRS